MRLLTSYKQCNIIILLSLNLCCSVSAKRTSNHHRRILHQPFFPSDSIPPTLPPRSASPQPQPRQHQHQHQHQHQPKLPFSSSPYNTQEKPFFPSYHSLPPPPSPTALATFPANITSLLLPQPSSPNRHPIIAIAVSVSLFFAALLASLLVFIFYHRHRKYTADNNASRSDSVQLYPPDTAISDSSHKPHGPSSTSSEFLYLDTVINSQEAIDKTRRNSSCVSTAVPYLKLGSPELKPLPPLPRYNFRRNSNEEDDDEEGFFSPSGSSGRHTLVRIQAQEDGDGNKLASRSFNSRLRTPSCPCLELDSDSPSNSVTMNSSTALNLSPRHSPGSIIKLPLPIRGEQFKFQCWSPSDGSSFHNGKLGA